MSHVDRLGELEYHNTNIFGLDGCVMPGQPLNLTRGEWLEREILPKEPWLRMQLKRRGVGPGEVDDLVQDTYVKLLATAQVSHIRNLSRYLLQTAIFLVISKARRTKVVSIVPFPERLEESIACDSPGQDRVADGRAELEAVNRALSALPCRHRDAFVLRRIDGLSTLKTAALLGVSTSAVEKHVRAASIVLNAGVRNQSNC